MRQLRGVIFDLDGTLVVQELDFEAMRCEIGLPSGTPLLEALDGMDGDTRAAAVEVLRRHELAAAQTARLNPGVADFLKWLDEPRCAACRPQPQHARSGGSSAASLRADVRSDPAREDAPYKPNPEGIWQICAAWEMTPDEVLMIGDYRYDIEAGHNAGTRTALVTHGRSLAYARLADVAFASFEDVPATLRQWFDEDR